MPSAPHELRAEDEEDPYSGCTWRKELAGYGFGLPLTRRERRESKAMSLVCLNIAFFDICRLHAQYFGGDVFMQALPGHGSCLGTVILAGVI